MAKWWLFYVGAYVAGGLTLIVADWIYREVKRRRQAKIIARRLRDMRYWAAKTPSTRFRLGNL